MEQGVRLADPVCFDPARRHLHRRGELVWRADVETTNCVFTGRPNWEGVSIWRELLHCHSMRALRRAQSSIPTPTSTAKRLSHRGRGRALIGPFVFAFAPRRTAGREAQHRQLLWK